jgi:hypothetical protein
VGAPERSRRRRDRRRRSRRDSSSAAWATMCCKRRVGSAQPTSECCCSWTEPQPRASTSSRMPTVAPPGAALAAAKVSYARAMFGRTLRLPQGRPSIRRENPNPQAGVCWNLPFAGSLPWSARTAKARVTTICVHAHSRAPTGNGKGADFQAFSSGGGIQTRDLRVMSRRR